MLLSVEIKSAVLFILKSSKSIPAELLRPGQIRLLQRGPVQRQLGEETGGVVVQEPLFTPPPGPETDVERAVVPEMFSEETVRPFRGVQIVPLSTGLIQLA